MGSDKLSNVGTRKIQEVKCKHQIGLGGTLEDIKYDPHYLFKKCSVCGEEITLKRNRGVVTNSGAPVAFYKDKRGNRIGVDAKGNVTDKDPYYKNNDPRGWKYAGKSTQGYNRSIHLDEGGNELK